MKILHTLSLACGVLVSACNGSDTSVRAETTQDDEQQIVPGRVLLIGMDGTRPDALQVANTPNIDGLIADGAVDWQSQVDYQTFSGPGWSSMLTGVWCDKHKVDDNEFPRRNFSQYPHYIVRAREQKPELVTASVVNWVQLNRMILENQADFVATDLSDTEVASEAARLLSSENIDLMFVNFDDVDGRGHACCYAPDNDDYLAEIEETDNLVGQVITALQARPNFQEENWLVIMTTDHGGSDSSHGEDTPEDRITWYLTSGARSAIMPSGSTRVTDAAVTALAHLGLPIEAEWDLDGVVSGLKGAPEMSRRESPNTCYVTEDDRAYLLTKEWQSCFSLLRNHSLREAAGLLGLPVDQLPSDAFPFNLTLEEAANMAGVSSNAMVQSMFEALGQPLLLLNDSTGVAPPPPPYCG